MTIDKSLSQQKTVLRTRITGLLKTVNFRMSTDEHFKSFAVDTANFEVKEIGFNQFAIVVPVVRRTVNGFQPFKEMIVARPEFTSTSTMVDYFKGKHCRFASNLLNMFRDDANFFQGSRQIVSQMNDNGLTAHQVLLSLGLVK